MEKLTKQYSTGNILEAEDLNAITSAINDLDDEKIGKVELLTFSGITDTSEFFKNNVFTDNTPCKTTFIHNPDGMPFNTRGNTAYDLFVVTGNQYVDVSLAYAYTANDSLNNLIIGYIPASQAFVNIGNYDTANRQLLNTLGEKVALPDMYSRALDVMMGDNLSRQYNKGKAYPEDSIGYALYRKTDAPTKYAVTTPPTVFEDNTVYNIVNPCTSLNISSISSSTNGIVIYFTASSSFSSFAYPKSSKWTGSNVPTVTPGKSYMITIIDNIFSIIEISTQ